jgi:hypothetical protein
MNYDLKSGVSAFFQLKLSTVSGSSFNPVLGQNITLGGSYDFNRFLFINKEDISAGFKFNKFTF